MLILYWNKKKTTIIIRNAKKKNIKTLRWNVVQNIAQNSGMT